MAFDEAHASAALDANSRFGKGRHPAALNFGDCCTYAVASAAGEPLCVGDDFARTDLLLVSLEPDESSTDLEVFRQDDHNVIGRTVTSGSAK